MPTALGGHARLSGFGMPTPSRGHATRPGSAEQLRGEVAQVVPPVDPGVAAAADVQLVLDAVLGEDLRQRLRAGKGEVLVADTDREQLHRPVHLVGAAEEVRVTLFEVFGVLPADAGAPDADVGEL